MGKNNSKFLKKVWLKVYLLCIKRGISSPSTSASTAVKAAKEEFNGQ